MARPIWKGHITFGLVSIPVSLMTGEKHSELSFRLIDNRDNARIRYEKVNELTGEPVPADHISKAYEYSEGKYVVLEDEDIQRAAAEASQTVEIQDFVDEAKIASVYYEKPYYLIPGKKAEKGYVILREAMKRSGKVGIAKVVIRTKQYLAALIPWDNALVLNLLRFHDEIRQPGEFELPGDDLESYNVSQKEMELAEQLIGAMAGEWQPEKYQDDFKVAMLKWIEEKAETGQLAAAPTRPAAEEVAAGEIVDIGELLKKSVQETAAKKAVSSE